MEDNINDLTKKQAEFVTEYLDTGNGTQAALKAYDTEDPKVAAVIASQNLTKLNIIAFLEDKAEKVVSNMYHLALNAEKQSDQISAGKDILDRAGFKPVDKSDVTSDGKPLQMFFDKRLEKID